jgi:hypothetical protein
MSNSEMLEYGQGMLGMRLGRYGQPIGTGANPLEYFMATGLGSRGGPNKTSNKLRRSPQSYDAIISQEQLMATALRSRGGPNKASNKLKRSLASYLYN